MALPPNLITGVTAKLHLDERTPLKMKQHTPPAKFLPSRTKGVPMGRKSRDKGQRGEREAAAELIRLFGCEACRGRQYHGGDDSPDVRHSIAGVHFEVKRTEKLALWPAVNQAVDECGESIPVVLHRPNGKPWLAVVRLDDLPALVVKLYLQLVEKS